MKSLLTLVLLCLLCGCSTNEKHYIIDGAVYGGGKFEGETIYLVPFQNASSERIDSAVVHNGCFRFEGVADSSEIYILRMRPMMRLFIQELLVVREPGHIRTILNKISSASGTPLNDSFQVWKNYKVSTDSILSSWSRYMKKPMLDSLEYNKTPRRFSQNMKTF